MVSIFPCGILTCIESKPGGECFTIACALQLCVNAVANARRINLYFMSSCLYLLKNFYSIIIFHHAFYIPTVATSAQRIAFQVLYNQQHQNANGHLPPCSPLRKQYAPLEWFRVIY